MDIKFFKQTTIILAVLLLVQFFGTTLLVRKYFSYKHEQPLASAVTGDTDVPDGLVAHLECETVVNNSTPNSSRHSNDGVFKSVALNASRFVFGTPKLTEGAKGNALEFNGKNWVSVGNRNCFNTGKFTLAVWAWQEKDEGVVLPTIMSKSDWPHYNGWWLCTMTEEGTDLARDVNLAVSWGNDHYHIQSEYQLPLKEWHHIAVTMDNDFHEAQFYIDGVAHGPRHTDVPPWLINWNHDLFVGDYDGSGRWPWVGKLDDVRFYRGVLTPEEIAAIYSGLPVNERLASVTR